MINTGNPILPIDLLHSSASCYDFTLEWIKHETYPSEPNCNTIPPYAAALMSPKEDRTD